MSSIVMFYFTGMHLYPLRPLARVSVLTSKVYGGGGGRGYKCYIKGLQCDSPPDEDP